MLADELLDGLDAGELMLSTEIRAIGRPEESRCFLQMLIFIKQPKMILTIKSRLP